MIIRSIFLLLIWWIILLLNLFIYFGSLFSIKNKIFIILVDLLVSIMFYFVFKKASGLLIIVEEDYYFLITGLVIMLFYFFFLPKIPEFLLLLLFFMIDNILMVVTLRFLFIPLGLYSYAIVFNLFLQICLTLIMKIKLKKIISFLFNSKIRLFFITFFFTIVLGSYFIWKNNKFSRVVRMIYYEINSQKQQVENKIFVLLVIFICIFGVYLKHEIKNNQKLIQLEYEKMMLETYIETLEKIQLEIKKNQHDYKNLLMGIRGFISKDGIDKKSLEDFLLKNQLIFTNDQITSGTLNQLKGINLPSVKGLISTKIIQAVQIGIKTKIKCSETIEFNEVDSFNLSRIFGIILDNAIEACAGRDNSIIEMIILDEKKHILIFVANSCSESILNLKIGESSKGANRGFGLKNLKDIVQNSDHLELETTCSNHIFSQKIFVKK